MVKYRLHPDGPGVGNTDRLRPSLTGARPESIEILAREGAITDWTFAADLIASEEDSYMIVVSDSHYQSTLDAVYVDAVPWSEYPIGRPSQVPFH